MGEESALVPATERNAWARRGSVPFDLLNRRTNSRGSGNGETVPLASLSRRTSLVLSAVGASRTAI